MTRAARVPLLLAPAAPAADDRTPDATAETAALKGKWKVTATRYTGKAVAVGAAGRYARDGVALTPCYGEPGAARPATPESKADDKVFRLVLERVKP